MATIQEINHDSSTTLTDHYDTIVDPDNSVTVTTAAALRSSTNGLNINADGTQQVSLTKDITFSTNDFRFRFALKLNGLTNNNAGVEFLLIRIADKSSAPFAFEIRINANAGDAGFNITVIVDQDGKSGNVQLGDGTDTIASSGEVCVELRAIKEVSSGSNDGEAELYVNGVSIDSDLTLDNNTTFDTIDGIVVIFAPDTDISGDLFLDELLLTDDEATSLGCDDFVGYDLVLGGGQP